MKHWVFDERPSTSQLAEIAAALLGGGVVLLPTDTIYGLHAVTSNEPALAQIAALKGREPEKKFLTLAASVEQIESLGANVPSLLRDLWPAPLTAILRADHGTIAVRIPDAAWLRELISVTGPLASTSANRSGEPPVTHPDFLSNGMRKGLAGVADNGPREGEPSALVDFTENSPRVLREGPDLFTQKLRKTLRKWL